MHIAPRKVNAIGPQVEADSIGPVEKSSKLATLGNYAVPLALIAHSDLLELLERDFCQMFHVVSRAFTVIHVVVLFQGFSESPNRRHSNLIIRIVEEYNLFVILRIFSHGKELESFSNPNQYVLSMEMKYVSDAISLNSKVQKTVYYFVS